MRTIRIPAVVALILTLAACTGGASPAPSPEPSPAPSVEPSSEPDPSPTGDVEPLALSASFDGETCSYTGPWVVPGGTLTEFAYSATEDAEPSVLVVIAAIPGTTWDQIVKDAESRPSSDIPDYLSELSFVNVDPGESALFTLRAAHLSQDFGGYMVGCATAPDEEGGSDRMFPAAYIEFGA